jgi:hypothetical protein
MPPLTYGSRCRILRLVNSSHLPDRVFIARIERIPTKFIKYSRNTDVSKWMRSHSSASLTLNRRAVCSFKVLGCDYPVIQYYAREEWNHRGHYIRQYVWLDVGAVRVKFHGI